MEVSFEQEGWAFAELTQVYEIESDIAAKVEAAVDAMVARAGAPLVDAVN